MTSRRFTTRFAACVVGQLALVAVSALLGAPAGADTPGLSRLAPEDDPNILLWGDTSRTSKLVSAQSFAQFAQLATTQVSVLSTLRSWRDTLSGNGTNARRDLLSSQFGGQKLGLSLGNVSPPTLAGFGGNGLAAHWGALEVGSTYRPLALDKALLQWDQAMSGKKQNLTDQQFVTWMRAKPWDSKGGALELTLARASRDVKPGEDIKWQGGTFMSGKGRMNLPLKWAMNGEWNSARLDNQQAHRNWMAQADGPLVHPWGSAKAHLEWKQIDAGYRNLTSENRFGEQSRRADITQDIKIGALNGQVQCGFLQNQRDDFTLANAGDELAKQSAGGGAKLNYQFSPNLSLGLQTNLSSLETERAAGDPNSAADDSAEQVKNLGADVGLEWKASKTLSLTALVGHSAIESQREVVGVDGTALNQTLPGQQEQRLSLELKQQGKSGQLGLRFTTRNREKTSFSGPNNPWMQVDTLRFEAGRKIGGTDVKTLIDIAHDRQADWGDSKGLARHAEAQLQFSPSTRLDLRYRDGAPYAATWWNDPLNAQLGNLSVGDSEYGARFNTGSAAGSKGFGLTFEYARSQIAGNDKDVWKVGVTYQ